MNFDEFVTASNVKHLLKTSFSCCMWLCNLLLNFCVKVKKQS